MTTLITDKMPVAVDGNKDGVLMTPSYSGLNSRVLAATAIASIGCTAVVFNVCNDLRESGGKTRLPGLGVGTPSEWSVGQVA